MAEGGGKWKRAQVHYYKYLNFTSYFGYETKNTALNTSGAFNGSTLPRRTPKWVASVWFPRSLRGITRKQNRILLVTG